MVTGGRTDRLGMVEFGCSSIVNKQNNNVMMARARPATTARSIPGGLGDQSGHDGGGDDGDGDDR
jgi:hypothetical protein